MVTLGFHAETILYNWAIEGFEHAFEYTFAYFGPLITLIVYGLYFMQYLPIALAFLIGYYVTTSCILPLIFYSYLAWRYLTGRVPWSAVRNAYSEGKSKRSPMYGPCTSNPLTTNYFTNGVKGRSPGLKPYDLVVCSPDGRQWARLKRISVQCTRINREPENDDTLLPSQQQH